MYYSVNCIAFEKKWICYGNEEVDEKRERERVRKKGGEMMTRGGK